MPSPEEIRAKCLAFQATWSDEERARRLVGGAALPRPVEIMVIPESALRSDYGGGDESFSIEDLADGTSGA